MKTVHDLSKLQWKLTGMIPHQWRSGKAMETGVIHSAEVSGIPTQVPGSVQRALLNAGLIPDWNIGLNARSIEWVENRHWVFQATIPDAWVRSKQTIRLRCLGLDYNGWVLLNGQEVGAFTGTFVPHVFELGKHLKESGNLLQIVFDLPPRWLGQLGLTSQMREWKTRFNYTWDWICRMVQIGIWDDMTLEIVDGPEIRKLKCTTDYDLKSHNGVLRFSGSISPDKSCRVRVTIADGKKVIKLAEFNPRDFSGKQVTWKNLPIKPWWPNGLGGQKLYEVSCSLLDAGGKTLDEQKRMVGFKHVEWRKCAGAPRSADPWICVVNGRAMFLQGVNWTPIRPDFADVAEGEYQKRIKLYSRLGLNMLRVWGGAFLEKECFYRMCDENGLLVWQEFPLSSSGTDNWPPEDKGSIEALAEIAESYIERRQHHASLLLWCGGNELQGGLDGSKVGCGKPVDNSHPLIGRLAKVVAKFDPGRRFLPSSSSGPRFYADKADFGKGLHWDVHGPWSMESVGKKNTDWIDYWSKDDSLFRSETGAPGASPCDIIRKFKGELKEMPATIENPLWKRTYWWIEWPEFLAEKGRKPRDLAEFVRWSQTRQAKALAFAARACKSRFPGCGGFIIWMGHDSFPCTANTAIVDFYGRPKPAALALSRIFREKTRF